MQEVIRTAKLVAAVEEHGADHRRDRHRQGTGRAGDPRPQRAARDAARSRSTARRFPRRCSSPSCSATCAARSPARRRTRRASSRSPTAASIFLDEIGTMTPGAPGEAAARAAGARIRAARLRAQPARRRARHRRDQPRSAPDGGGRPVPGGSLLPPQRHPDRHPAAARAARGHPGAGRALRRASTRSAPASGSSGIDDGVLRDAAGLRLARQRARAREHDRARGRALDRPGAQRPTRSRMLGAAATPATAARRR